MRTFTTTQKMLLNKLADGNCHSGESLGADLKISRTAVWKQIHQLRDLGIPIDCHKQQGYQILKPYVYLDEQKIIEKLHPSIQDKIDCCVFSSISSTNQFLKDLAVSKPIACCCAEMQTKGRGRFGRTWLSPFGENIYFSIRFQITSCLAKLSGLSLLVGLSMVKVLAELNVQDIYVKWPNDLIWQDKKLCGILIEIQTESNSSSLVTIGIGLNVNSNPAATTDIPSCSLHDISQEYYDRNHLIAQMTNQIYTDFYKFLSTGFSTFLSEWERCDYLKGKMIQIKQANEHFEGEMCGVDTQGQMILKDKNGNKRYCSSGDATLKID